MFCFRSELINKNIVIDNPSKWTERICKTVKNTNIPADKRVLDYVLTVRSLVLNQFNRVFSLRNVIIWEHFFFQIIHTANEIVL